MITISQASLNHALKLASIAGRNGSFVCGASQPQNATSDIDQLILHIIPGAFDSLSATESEQDLIHKF